MRAVTAVFNFQFSAAKQCVQWTTVVKTRSQSFHCSSTAIPLQFHCKSFQCSYYHFSYWNLELRFKDIPHSLEAVIKAIQASMSSLRSEFSKLKKLGSLQSILHAACYLIKPEMLLVRSKNAKRRLKAIVEAMDENIEHKWLFLLENYHNSLGIKGFSHNCTNSLRTASVHSTGTYAPPCRLHTWGRGALRGIDHQFWA